MIDYITHLERERARAHRNRVLADIFGGLAVFAILAVFCYLCAAA